MKRGIDLLNDRAASTAHRRCRQSAPMEPVRLNVLHVIPGVAPRDGGPSVAIHAIVKGLAVLGARVSVATTNADGRGELEVPVDRPVIIDNATYHYFRRTLSGDWKFSVPLTVWLIRNISQFDVVHVHALFSYATIPACRLASRAGIPFVLRPLGTLDRWSLQQKAWKKRPYLRFVERRHLADAAAIHVTSPQEADAVAALGYGRKARLVPLGADLPDERKRSRKPGPFRLLYLSRLHAKKGLPLLLEALSKVLLKHPGSAELIVAGRGTPTYEQEMRSLCETLGIHSHVRFAGQVDGDAKHQLLADSDLFVLPSHTENFGIAVAEAMAASLPVIVSNQVGLAHAIRRANAGIVVPRDSDAIAASIDRLMHDAEECSRLGDNGRMLVAQQFSWSRTSEALASLYDEITSLHTGTAR